MAIEIICCPTGPLSTNTYIVYDGSAEPEGGKRPCAVVDPASSHRVLDVLDRNGLHCTHILLTHGHFDHIMGVAEIKSREGAEVLIHRDDADAVSGSGSLAYMAGALVKKFTVDRLLGDGDVFTAAGMTFRVIHTPGHTPGGVCYVLENERVIFCGDTLFRLSVGRTDLSGGSDEQLYESILYRLFPLHGDYRLLPGHDRETTLDFEREHNPYMKRGAY